MQSSYDARQIKFTEHIRESYGEKRESDLERLRKLDGRVKRPAAALAYILGVVAALLLGVGMCICMGEIGAENLFYLGVVVGAAGIILAAVNYPIYRAVLKGRKRKYSAEIIALSNKILGEEGNADGAQPEENK